MTVQRNESLSGWQQFVGWSARVRLARKAAYLIAGLAVIAGVVTVSTMTGEQNELQDILYLLYVDIVLLLILSGLIVAKLVRVWLERRKGRSGAGFHGRLVLMFSLIAVTPAVLVAVFSAIFLNVGIQGWFNERISDAVNQSAQVAKAYLQEHRQAVRGDIFAMANDLNRDAPTLVNSRFQFDRTLEAQAVLRNLPEAIVTDRSGNILARAPFSQSLEFELAPIEAFDKADGGDIVIMTNPQDDRIRAMIRLTRFVDAYLVVGRFVDPVIVEFIDRVKRSVTQYQSVEEQRSGLQVTFLMLFSVVALLLLLAAAWVGLTLATRYARPITELADAAEKVREGDLDVRIAQDGGVAEIDTLVDAFNRMAGQLEHQKQGLLDANRELDERRRFTETVLTGVSAGVIGLDNDGRIHLPNPSASNLLMQNLDNEKGKPLGEVVPEMAEMVEEAIGGRQRAAEHELSLQIGDRERTLIARIAAEKLDQDEVIGYVVTFDDITDLESAQRKAAWADVARRIAHEIRNPLTPIQLAAERLKRRYLKDIEGDKETFENCTDTIIRQVGDIGRMVDEFSSFARMPDPEMRSHDIVSICRDAVFLEQNRYSSIAIEFDAPAANIAVTCDRDQLSRAIGNVLKNASESVASRLQTVPDPTGQVRLILSEPLEASTSQVRIDVIDNGVGLPRENRHRLTEPYVTSREKGTGLGLAIVKKIIEDHDGHLTLTDAPAESNGVQGAIVSIVLNVNENLSSDTVDDETAQTAARAG